MDRDEVVFNTPGTVGGSVINVAGNYIIQGGDEGAHAEHMRRTDGALRAQAFIKGHLLPSLLPFNDAPVDRLSSCFTGRHEDVQFIADTLGSPTGSVPTRCAIWGMHWLGKSQLGLKYAHSYFESERYTHVFWIQATTVEKLTQGLANVLILVQHPERHNSDQAAQLTAARGCFEHSQKYGFIKWLIILDDATAKTVSFLRQNLPRQNANGSILITTRTLDVAEALANVAGQQHPVCELKALSPVHSAELLLQRAGIHSRTTTDLESVQQLVQRIGCLPLAVDQAGAFMEKNRFSSADQLNSLYDKHGSGEIIGWKNSLTTYEETSILAAFAVQFQRLGEIDRDVLSFLRLLACFDPEHIPINILVLGAERARHHLASNAKSTSAICLAPKERQSTFHRLISHLPGKRERSQPLTVLQNDDVETASSGVPEKQSTFRRLFTPEKREKPRPLTAALQGGNSETASAEVPLELRHLLERICSDQWLREAFRHLEDLSLARPLYGDTTSLHIHDLIQQVVIQQTTAAQESGENPYHALAVTLLSQAFPTIEDTQSPQSWTECERFVPHLMSLTKHVGTSPINSLWVLSVRVAGYFISRGRYEEAVALCQHALAGQTQQLGEDHPDTLSTVNNLAELYRQQAKYEAAETLCQRALSGRELQLGRTHRDTLSAVHNLATLYEQQGKLDKAEVLYCRAMAGREQQLGVAYPDTLRTVNGLALVYSRQGKPDEAETLNQRALAGREQRLGEDHPDTLLTVNDLAGLYDQQGKYVEAEALYWRALAGYEQHLGADHPETLRPVNSLAALYHKQAKYVEAEALYRRALAGYEQQLGADHPRTLITVHNVALLHKNQGKYDEAETLYQRVLVGNETSLGIHHPHTIRVMEDLADVYEEQGRDGEESTLRARAEEAEKFRLS
ncbi:TPR-like protein [Athelia psychrophila]|uniref:TPR-like protein n=1 Tax=Athelia psychrophila TaxID=1759441 RepID=A0A166MVQ5_9AGAM|nr:TPR-like protein [Fibularhizoctonia sp. CBS 109695]